MKQVVERKHLPSSLGQFIQTTWNFSKRIIRHLKARPGCLLVNNAHATVRYSLKEGDVVTVHFPPEERGRSMVAEEIPLEIIYENEDFLIVNKRAGMPISPTANHPSGTLANGIIHYYDLHGLPYTVHIVTRLDRDTSGLVVIAKHRYMHALFNQNMQTGEIQRSYEAIVGGRLVDDEGTIDAPIRRKEGSIIERIVDPTGKRSITHYNVLKKTSTYSHVAIQLETGRTHQIRVHFSSLGYPLLGDTLYGVKTGEIDRHALHCSHIAFIHPQTNKHYAFTAPIPTDMKAIVH